jgi:hypothetical protein
MLRGAEQQLDEVGGIPSKDVHFGQPLSLNHDVPGSISVFGPDPNNISCQHQEPPARRPAVWPGLLGKQACAYLFDLHLVIVKEGGKGR